MGVILKVLTIDFFIGPSIFYWVCVCVCDVTWHVELVKICLQEIQLKLTLNQQKGMY